LTETGFAGWLNSAAIWWIAFWLLLAMIAASVAGQFIRRQLKRKLGEDGKEAEGEKGFVLSSVLGLLALLLGFTFALAVDRFETRRALVLEEANAIGTTYLRAQLLEEPHRSRISRLLVDYTDNRIEIAKATPEEARRLLGRNDRMVTELWVATVAVFPTIRGLDFSTAFIDSVNAVIDLDESRKAARQARVPYEVYVGLFIYIIASSGLVGFTLDGPRERSAAIFLFVLLTLAMMLILDIDRPATGGINESQWPMEDLRASLRTWPPEVFDPGGAPARDNTR
jgi:hypothetical protein